ncbi:hypothetical protein D3C73_775060 [compost metagenome]
MVAQGTVLRIPGGGTVEHQLGRARGTHIATGVGQGGLVGRWRRRLRLATRLADPGITGRYSGLKGLVHGAPLVTEEDPLKPPSRHDVAHPVRLVSRVRQPQVVAQLMCQGQRLPMDGDVAGAGVSIASARRTICGSHTDRETIPLVAACPAVILVAAQHIDVGEDLFRVRDPALPQRRRQLHSTGFVGLAIAILVPFVHQDAVVHPAEADVVGGKTSAHVRHDDVTVVPQMALTLAGEGDVAVGEADRLGGGNKQSYLIHLPIIGQDFEGGLALCQPLQHQPILGRSRYQLQTGQFGVGDAITERHRLRTRHLGDQQRLRLALTAKQLLFQGRVETGIEGQLVGRVGQHLGIGVRLERLLPICQQPEFPLLVGAKTLFVLTGQIGQDEFVIPIGPHLDGGW